MTEDSNYNTHVKGKYYLILLISKDIKSIKEKSEDDSDIEVGIFVKTLVERLGRLLHSGSNFDTICNIDSIKGQRDAINKATSIYVIAASNLDCIHWALGYAYAKDIDVSVIKNIETIEGIITDNVHDCSFEKKPDLHTVGYTVYDSIESDFKNIIKSEWDHQMDRLD